jgi:hypothetical protein
VSTTTIRPELSAPDHEPRHFPVRVGGHIVRTRVPRACSAPGLVPLRRTVDKAA